MEIYIGTTFNTIQPTKAKHEYLKDPCVLASAHTQEILIYAHLDVRLFPEHYSY